VLHIKKILGQVRKAIQDYDMIREGDRIAVGVSGGKDSLTLLIALSQLQKFYPASFELEAITITMGIGKFDLTPVKELCAKLGVNYTIEETLIGKIVFEERNEDNPCSLCANMRRGALHNVAGKLGCNRVALAHHKDDVIETFLLSLFYEGRIHTFSPVTYLDRKNLYVIRPLIYAEEKDIRGFIKSSGITPVPSPCNVDGKTKRQDIKDLISAMSREKRDLKSSIFGAIKRSKIDLW
jgi:tRNA(Ile)-lysidine synthase TilS/MesJ